ncbi:MAG: formylglycine-generating enzyme family protein [Candidatus Cloacimonetes bacterium]|nr:formylglycine-generating enzyme family protein [Candidatus Cloacimonadota bacterium]
MKKTFFTAILLLSALILFALPIPENVTITITDSETVIHWDLVDGADYYKIYRSIFSNNPDWGVSIGSTTNLQYIDTDISQEEKLFYKITAISIPAGFGFVAAGNFDMGYNYDSSGTWWYPTETPVHTVYISNFYMEKYEIYKTKWDNVYSWAIENGYSFDNSGEAQAPNHPVYNINWYDVVKWCNALHLFTIPIQLKTRFIKTGKLILIRTR